MEIENAGKKFDEFAFSYLDIKDERNIVLVASSRMDDVLFEILEKYFLPKISKPSDLDELLGGDRPLASFSSRLKIVYRLGLIDQSFCDILEKVREIRNKSAHMVVFRLNVRPLKQKMDHLLSLIKAKESYSNIKNQYYKDKELEREEVIKCAYLTICFLLEAIRLKIEKISENPETISISKK